MKFEVRLTLLALVANLDPRYNQFAVCPSIWSFSTASHCPTIKI